MTEVQLDPRRQAFIAAYLRLDLDFSASERVIKSRCTELRAHHRLDQYAAGSVEGARAAERLAEIEADYRLIHRAPLEHDPGIEVIRQQLAEKPAAVRLDRPVSVAAETAVLMALGAAVGMLRRFESCTAGRPGTWLFWTLPPILAFLFTTTSQRVRDILWVLSWWTGL